LSVGRDVYQGHLSNVASVLHGRITIQKVGICEPKESSINTTKADLMNEHCDIPYVKMAEFWLSTLIICLFYQWVC
jgi:hypothetical protein